MNIRIIKISDDKLARETWDFHFGDRKHGDSSSSKCGFGLSLYAYETRQTTRHGWKNKKLYEAHRIEVCDPVTWQLASAEIVQEAKELILKKIAKEIKFLGWAKCNIMFVD